MRYARYLPAALLILALGCQPERPADQPEMPAPPATERLDLPAPVWDPSVRPDADLFLPPLAGYSTDDDAEPGELAASLDHGSVAHAEVRRRLVLDEQGFALVAVSVVTFEPRSGGPEPYLRHRFGDARRTPLEVEGVEMQCIEVDPHPVIAWTDPTFAVTFERGSAVSDDWLLEVVRATLSAMAAR